MTTKSSLIASLLVICITAVAGDAQDNPNAKAQAGAASQTSDISSATAQIQEVSKESSSPAAPLTDKLVLSKIFHIAGVPKLKRNASGDLILTDRELIFQQGKKQKLALPYERIRRVQLLSGKRHYAKAAYVTAVAAGLPGALLILKTRKVDTLVLDYLNERGGLMGMVLQVPEKKGDSCKGWLVHFKVAVEEPE